MPKVLRTLEFGKQPTDPNWKMMRRIYEQLAKVVNGRISIGQNTQQTNPSLALCDNIDAVSILNSTVGTGAADFTITHNLGRIPTGFIITGKTASVDIWNGAGAWTATTMTLRSSVNGVQFRMIVY